MRELITSLRFRLATAGFIAAYAPTLLFLVVAVAFSYTEERDVSAVTNGGDGGEVTTISTGLPIWLVVAVTFGFAPVAAWFAWWWSGRAVRPIEEAVNLQEQLIEETSHELRTPLAVLATNSDVLLAHPDPSLEVFRQGLHRTRSVVERMTETIDSLLVDARGRARSIARTPVDMAAVVVDVVESLSVLADSNDVTVVVGSMGSVPARVDRPSVERAVSNVVGNAIRHGPAGSTVQVDVASDGPSVIVAVTDEGPGIPEALQEKILERYWRSERSEGFGIGLAIVRQVALAHGGSVEIESPVSERGGTQFRLRLRT